jgi:formylglycine-generating enzyme required for sulfatase activity
VGFKHWHPVSVTDKGDKLCGQSDLGGVWEWTSTVLEKHDKFEPMTLYPGYTGTSKLLRLQVNKSSNTNQRTFLTANTTSHSVVRGRHILVWRAARPCE